MSQERSKTPQTSEKSVRNLSSGITLSEPKQKANPSEARTAIPTLSSSRIRLTKPGSSKTVIATPTGAFRVSKHHIGPFKLTTSNQRMNLGTSILQKSQIRAIKQKSPTKMTPELDKIGKRMDNLETLIRQMVDKFNTTEETHYQARTPLTGSTTTGLITSIERQVNSLTQLSNDKIMSTRNGDIDCDDGQESQQLNSLTQPSNNKTKPIDNNQYDSGEELQSEINEETDDLEIISPRPGENKSSGPKTTAKEANVRLKQFTHNTNNYNDRFITDHNKAPTATTIHKASTANNDNYESNSDTEESIGEPITGGRHRKNATDKTFFNQNNRGLYTSIERTVIKENDTEPPKFYGDFDQAAVWLVGYKEVAFQNKWTEDIAIRKVSRSLQKEAHLWYRSVWSGNRYPETWHEFEKEFMSTYLEDDLESIMREKLQSLQQKKGQTLNEYFFTAMEICNYLGETVPLEKKIRYIIKGMDCEPRRHLKNRQPTNLAQIRYFVKDWTLDTEPKGKLTTRNNSKEGKNTSEGNTNRTNGPFRPREENWCLNCGLKGHYTRGCPKQINQQVVDKRREDWKFNPPYKKINKQVTTPKSANQVVTDTIEEQTQAEDTIMVQTIKTCEPPQGIQPPMPFRACALAPIEIRARDSSKLLCRVNGQLEEATLDTGASVTVTSLARVQQTKTTIYTWKWAHVRLANGEIIEPVGWCALSIEYDDRTYTVSAVILPEAPDLLLGMDYAHTAGLIISFKEDLITYYDKYMNKIVQEHLKRITPNKTSIETQTTEENINRTNNSEQGNKDPQIKINYVEYFDDNKNVLKSNRVSTATAASNKQQPYMVRSKRMITLPPLTKARIEVKTSCDITNNEPLFVEPLANSIIHALPGINKKAASVIEVINISRQAVTIGRREMIAQATPMKKSELEIDKSIKKPPDLSSEQDNKLTHLLNKYKDLFVTQNEAIGIVPFIKHKIDTGDSEPVRSKPYRVSRTEQETIQQLIQEMLDADIIRPSRSHWSSPVVLVKKKGTSDLRFCVDYRKLNKITRVDPYPIPNMDSVLETLAGNHYFSKLDVKAMYWQVLVDEESRHKTAFVVHCGQYEFNVMPFGLVSAPMTAMRVMNEVTRGMDKTCFVFYDDILVFTPNFDTHITALEQLFNKLQEANIKLNASKCDLLLNKVTYLGHIVTPQGIKPDPEKLRSVEEWATPTNLKQARGFIGLCNFFRRYIKDFAKIARPIHDTIKIHQQFKWTPEAQRAMDILKVKLTSPPLLVHYDPKGDLTIRCDASGYGLGAVLRQDSSDSYKTGVIAYTSRTLIPSERNYATTHKECLAVVHAVKHWRHYLYGKHFKIITDHHALCWLMKNKDHTGQLMRWSLILQEFNFTVHYESGKLHSDADCLSRNPLTASETAQDESDIPLWPIHAIQRSKSTIDLYALKEEQLILPTYDMEAEQAKDSYCKPILQAFTQAEVTKKLRKRYKRYLIKDKLLYKRSQRDRNKYLLVLPQTMIEYVLRETHDTPISGHFGVKRTLDTIKQRFYWQTLNQDVIRYIKSCNLCQRKKTTHKKEGLLIPMPIPTEPFEIIGMDLMGPLPTSSNRFTHILVITDYLTKYVIAQPLRKTTTVRIMELFKKFILYTHGLPKVLITDNGSNLTSSQMRELLQLMKIKHKTTSPYRPQTNGQTERYNRVLGTQLTIFAEDKPKTWDAYLDALVFAYNTTIHASHLTTPYQLVHGRQPTKPVDRVIGKPIKAITANDDIPEEVIIRESRELARKLIIGSQLAAKKRYDKGRIKPKHKVGDLVLRQKPTRSIGERKKFSLPWIGPYKVIKVINDINYQIVSLEDPSDERVVHAAQIKPYHSRRIQTLQGKSDTNNVSTRNIKSEQ